MANKEGARDSHARSPTEMMPIAVYKNIQYVHPSVKPPPADLATNQEPELENEARKTLWNEEGKAVRRLMN